MTPQEVPFAGRVFPDPFPPLCASAWGDDRFGLWCEIEVGGVVQRLRWIEPGEFWMGSTEAERERFGLFPSDGKKRHFDGEAPRHRVVLTKGFWLADTTCTTALWRVIVGNRPNVELESMDHPVQGVSWNDVIGRFLGELGRRLGARDEIGLPTEAQWEYACRADAATAYPWGDNFTSEMVHASDTRSIKVKALLPNRWGLFQMLGNVWEWCADEPRIYSERSIVDPDGGTRSIYRAVRGGAWFSEPEHVRCAVRNRIRADTRLDYCGFRFALRSIEPGAGGGMGDLDEAGGAR